jgi:hypothetical protein
MQSANRESAPHAPRMPDFFIVGQPKAGTTALYEMLTQHPDVFMPDEKEPGFLASDLPLLDAASTSLPRTLAAYQELFAPARRGQQVGEASTLYLVSRVAARNIRELQPAARIVAVVREPVSLLRSLHLQALQNRDESKASFRRALALEPERRAGRRIPRTATRPHLLLYSEQVKYVAQLRRYHDAFGHEQVLVLVYDEFRRDNEATLRTVLRFLGVDDTVSFAAAEANPTARMRSRLVTDVVDDVAAGRGRASRYLGSGIKTLTTERFRRRLLKRTWDRVVYGPPRPIDPELRLELRRRFRPEVEALSDYLGRDLVALWGYDAIE